MPVTQRPLRLVLPAPQPAPEKQPPGGDTLGWTQRACPNCGYTRADVDRQGILWCPACGYSRQGCYT